MTDSPNHAFITMLPHDGEEAVHWWLVAEGAVMARGQDMNPVSAAGLEQAPPPEQSFVLIPAAQTVIRWFEFPDLSERQSEAAARLEALQHSIADEDEIHAASQYFEDSGKTIAATISKSAMARGLAVLNGLGLDPAVILPSALVISPQSGSFQKAVLGSETILRGPEIAIADDPAISSVILGEHSFQMLNASETDAALVAALEHPGINLRQGSFALRSRTRSVGSRGWKVLAALAALIGILTVLIMGTEWLKYENSIDRLDKEALTAAQRQVPEAADLTSAEQQLNAKLLTQGVGTGGFVSPASALFTAMQSAPNVSVRDMSYRSDGILSVQLAAPRNEDINPVLIAVQAAGYKITANPRQDSTGQAVADVTVRGS